MKKKECISLYKAEPYKFYYGTQIADYRFSSIYQIVSDEFEPGELIEWFMDATKESITSASTSIRKQRGMIGLYDISEYFADDNYMCINDMLFLEKRFEMSFKNFGEILFAWEELRVSRPDIILIVIHEDNHVSLETDPAIIKEYQDAGYAFGINKKE